MILAIDSSAIVAMVLEEPTRHWLAEHAIRAWRRFGRGRHPAALNYGDCFSYALAATRGVPLLCVGNDFRQTDLEVLAP